MRWFCFLLSDQQIKEQNSSSVFLFAYAQESHLNEGENPTFSIWGVVSILAYDGIFVMRIWNAEKSLFEVSTYCK